MKKVVLFCLLLGFTITATAGEKNVFKAEDPTSGSVQLLNADRCQTPTLAGKLCFEMEKETDPYEWNPYLFRFGEDLTKLTGPFVLEVRYVDKGAGWIDPSFLKIDRFDGVWSAPLRATNFCRLNTLGERSAFFEFDLGEGTWALESNPQLKIVGLQYVTELRIHTDFPEDRWERARASIPKDLEPMVRLERPMQLVMNAGAATHGATENLESDLNRLHEIIPLLKVLGFTSVETYVRWNWFEPREGEFDFTLLDQVADKIAEYDMKWFPLIAIGSAYATPKWFLDSDRHVGFVSLEHGDRNDIQSIWNPHHRELVPPVLKAFGDHFRDKNILEGVRLGPSGNFGESQYPAGGNWPAPGEEAMAIYIGWWGGDRYARDDYRRFVREKYETVKALNAAWGTEFQTFGDVEPRVPQFVKTERERLDITQWYTDSMTEWCEYWVIEARKAMPDIPLYQCAGGWGFREGGTDYSAQTKSMVKIDGGVRLTNETDSFDQNFFATRLATTAARLYDVDLGFEPASRHTSRGVAGRIFNTASTNGDHFFTYYPNIAQQPIGVEKWIEHAKVLDTRQDPVVDVAVYYPETANQLGDGAFRELYAWGFNPRAREVRRHVEVDYLDELLIRDGFLDRYKVLVHVWGNVWEADVLEAVDRWVRKGGVLIFPSFPRGAVRSVEGDLSYYEKWAMGDTGNGKFVRFKGDMEPPSLYGDFVKEILSETDSLHNWTKKALAGSRSDRVFWSVQEDGHLFVINYDGEEGFIELPGSKRTALEPYGLARIPLE